MIEMDKYYEGEEREQRNRLHVREWLQTIEELDALSESVALLGFSKQGLALAEISRTLKDNPP